MSHPCSQSSAFLALGTAHQKPLQGAGQRQREYRAGSEIRLFLLLYFIQGPGTQVLRVVDGGAEPRQEGRLRARPTLGGARGPDRPCSLKSWGRWGSWGSRCAAGQQSFAPCAARFLASFEALSGELRGRTSQDLALARPLEKMDCMLPCFPLAFSHLGGPVFFW